MTYQVTKAIRRILWQGRCSTFTCCRITKLCVTLNCQISRHSGVDNFPGSEEISLPHIPPNGTRLHVTTSTAASPTLKRGRARSTPCGLDENPAASSRSSFPSRLGKMFARKFASRNGNLLLYAVTNGDKELVGKLLDREEVWEHFNIFDIFILWLSIKILWI